MTNQDAISIRASELFGHVMAQIDLACPIDGQIGTTRSSEPDAMSSSQLAVLAQISPTAGSVPGECLKWFTEHVAKDQQSDGHWERSSNYWHTSITAWAVVALSSSERWTEPMKHGSTWLTARQHSNAGFPQSDTENRENTYAMLLAVSALTQCGKYTEEVRRGIRWLSSWQDVNGRSFAHFSNSINSNFSLTAHVIHGLDTIRSLLSRTIRRNGTRFVANSQGPTGGWLIWFGEDASIESADAAAHALRCQGSRYQVEIDNSLTHLLWVDEISELERWVLFSIAYALMEQKT